MLEPKTIKLLSSKHEIYIKKRGLETGLGNTGAWKHGGLETRGLFLHCCTASLVRDQQRPRRQYWHTE